MRPESFTRVVTSAFCKGDTRQQITALHLRSEGKEASSELWFESQRQRTTVDNHTHVGIELNCGFGVHSNQLQSAPSLRPWRDVEMSRCQSRRSFSFLTKSSTLMTRSFICGVMSEHACPILIAVSCLSPVSTQTAMFAFMSCSMVRGTPTCNLSSIAVEPNSVRSFSMRFGHLFQFLFTILESLARLDELFIPRKRIQQG